MAVIQSNAPPSPSDIPKEEQPFLQKSVGALLSMAKNLDFSNKILPEFKKEEPKKTVKKCETPKEVSKNCTRSAGATCSKIKEKSTSELITDLMKGGVTKEEALGLAKTITGEGIGGDAKDLAIDTVCNYYGLPSKLQSILYASKR